MYPNNQKLMRMMKMMITFQINRKRGTNKYNDENNGMNVWMTLQYFMNFPRKCFVSIKFGTNAGGIMFIESAGYCFCYTIIVHLY